MGLIETIGVVVTAVLAFAVVIGRQLKRAREAGEDSANEAARRLDHENAAAIRKRAADRSVRPKNKPDTRGYRD